MSKRQKPKDATKEEEPAKEDAAREDNTRKAHILYLVTEHGTRAFCTLCHCGVWIYGLHILGMGVNALAGRTTKADFLLNILTNLKADQSFAYLFGAGGAGWAVFERRLRKKTVAKVHERNKELEIMLDPKRSSSGLPKSGSTRKDDR